jgi:hypothetical protein
MTKKQLRKLGLLALAQQLPPEDFILDIPQDRIEELGVYGTDEENISQSLNSFIIPVSWTPGSPLERPVLHPATGNPLCTFRITQFPEEMTGGTALSSINYRFYASNKNENQLVLVISFNTREENFSCEFDFPNGVKIEGISSLTGISSISEINQETNQPENKIVISNEDPTENTDLIEIFFEDLSEQELVADPLEEFNDLIITF